MIEIDARFRYAGGFELAVDESFGRGVTAVTGPSGVGKTTLIRLIAGLLRPDGGRVAFDGEVWSDASAGVWVPPHRRGVGLVTQQPNLFLHRSVRGNLAFGATRRTGRTSATSVTCGTGVAEIATRLRIADLLDRMPSQISGGQAHRVSLGRSLASSPRLLLLDEPLASLDAGLREELVGVIAEVVGAFELPTVLVSHDEALVERLADRVVRL